jgi:hypothetical protein
MRASVIGWVRLPVLAFDPLPLLKFLLLVSLYSAARKCPFLIIHSH